MAVRHGWRSKMTIEIARAVKILRSTAWGETAYGRIRSINIGSAVLWGPRTEINLEDLEDPYAVLDVLDYLDADGQPTGDLELIEFQESIDCEYCSVGGYRGDHPHVGDLVVTCTGEIVCDACADVITREIECAS
jgi:hypothetical protein